MTVMVLGYLILIILFPHFLRIFGFEIHVYQTLETVSDHISKHLKVCHKYSASRHIFNSLLGVWKCGQTRSLLFDVKLFLCLLGTGVETTPPPPPWQLCCRAG